MWEIEMVEILRCLIDDMGESQSVSDANLVRVLCVAAFQVSREVTFSQTFTVRVAQTSISPDPSSSETRDDSFINLSCLKAACILDRAQAITAAKRAVMIRDGGSTMDARDVGKHRLALLEKGYCKVYEESRNEYQAGQVRVAGAAVMGPFRLYGGGGLWDGRGRQVITY